MSTIAQVLIQVNYYILEATNTNKLLTHWKSDLKKIICLLTLF